MPNDLETFLATLAICCFQDKFSPIITPRKTVSLTRSIEWLLNVIDISCFPHLSRFKNHEI